MDFFKTTPKIDFMGKRQIAIGLSVGLFVLSFIAFATRGLNFGIDFTGGTLIEVAYDRVVDLGDVRKQL
ncbi:MAG: protein translocase subunit SecF, partial [Gammaproteobacteria bacterium]